MVTLFSTIVIDVNLTIAGVISNSFIFTVITMRIEPSLNPQVEINNLHSLSNTLINPPHCYSGNVIIMGDFNQGTNFIPTLARSALDQDLRYQQLEYDGGTTYDKNPQKLDR